MKFDVYVELTDSRGLDCPRSQKSISLLSHMNASSQSQIGFSMGLK